MKIIINDRENYTIETNDEISREQFFELMGRLQHIMKLIGRDPLMEIAGKTPTVVNGKRKVKTKRYKIFYKSRDAVLEVLKAYYSVDREKLQKIIDKYDLQDKELIGKTVAFRFRKIWKVKPEEVGLARFPAKGRGYNIAALQMKNGKSNTEEEKEKETKALIS